MTVATTGCAVKVVEVKLVNENLAHARGGEVVLYRRPDSQRWQARFKLKDMQWRRTSEFDTKSRFSRFLTPRP